jgi:endonuclease YncB( thermonuclease family)
VKIVRFNPRRHRNASVALPSALIVVLLAVIGIVAYDKYWPTLPNDLSTFLGFGRSQPITGRASVIDGDTIEIHGIRIRLFGIDAPESGQSCRALGKDYRCGQRAALALSDKIGSQLVECQPRDRDRYGRVVGMCFAAGEEINAWMVAQGWALAYRHYSHDYVSQEQSASNAKLGMWRGEFEPPWDWRHSHAQPADLRSPQPTLSTGLPRVFGGDDFIRQGKAPFGASSIGCTIKGNISANGERIYHVRGGYFYDRTRINPVKGERWFCTEADARAAGWRRSRR